MSDTWLITGASKGLGAHLALHALRAGHTVIACSRDVVKAKKALPEIERLRGTWLELDVSDDEAEEIVSRAVELHRVNVLVNNAGYAVVGTLDHVTVADAKGMFELNFYGAVRCMKGAIPHFRRQRYGTIVNISSIDGIRGDVLSPFYSASMFALEGASESVAAGLIPFNVRVLTVMPSGFRSNFRGTADGPDAVSNSPYMQNREEIARSQTGDPDKMARAIIDAVRRKTGPQGWSGMLKLPLGRDALLYAQLKYVGIMKKLDVLKGFILSTDRDDDEPQERKESEEHKASNGRMEFDRPHTPGEHDERNRHDKRDAHVEKDRHWVLFQE